MPNPSRTKDLIEAIQMAIRKFKYVLDYNERKLLYKCIVNARKERHLEAHEWDRLCDLFNTIEGRKK